MADVLSESEIEEFMLSQRVGRVGCSREGETYVVPVIYAWSDRCVYVYTTEGQKVTWMRENTRVSFEVDEQRARGGWCSVILQGRYEELTGADAETTLDLLRERVAPAADAPPREAPRGDGRPGVAFRIVTDTITGRKVER